MEVINKDDGITSISSLGDSKELSDGRMTLHQCIQRIMSKKGDMFRKQLLADYKMAKRVAVYLIRWTYMHDGRYQNHIRTSHGRVQLSDIRTLDEHTFRCNVPLKSPSSANSLMFHYKRRQEIPPHRMLVTLDEDLDRVDKLYQKRVWKDCMDEDWVLRPDYVLKWFNRGLIATCETLKQERWKQLLVDEFRCNFETKTEAQPDGTLCIHFIMASEDSERKSLIINFVPSISLRKLPKQIRIRSPYPDKHQYSESRDQFEKDVLIDIKKGDILSLEACVWTQGHVTRLDKNISVTWSVSCSSLEEKGLQCVSKVMNPTVLENIILLIRKIRQEHLMGLNPLTNPMVQNAVFHVHRKNIGKYVCDDQWFLGVMETVAAQLQNNLAPSFFLNSRNLLEGWDKGFVHWMGNELQRVIRRITEKPQLLNYYVGSKGIFDSDDETEEDDDNNDEQKVNETTANINMEDTEDEECKKV